MTAPFLASRARKEAAQPLSAAAGVGQILQDDFGFELDTLLIGILHISVGRLTTKAPRYGWHTLRTIPSLCRL